MFWITYPILRLNSMGLIVEISFPLNNFDDRFLAHIILLYKLYYINNIKTLATCLKFVLKFNDFKKNR